LSGYIKQLNQTPASTLPVSTSLSLKSGNLEAEIKKLALDALRNRYYPTGFPPCPFLNKFSPKG